MNHRYVLNPIFIVGLLVVMLNDFALKDIYHNWWTGKLSDFAGMLILPLLIRWLFRVKDHHAIAIAVLSFIFWKSPYSQFLIDVFYFDRVVDYSDFMAFAVLPLSYYVLKHIDEITFTINRVEVRRALVVTLGLATILSTTAWSDDDMGEFEPEPLSSCCALDPINARVGNGRVYIPTMFTPDGNGLNDIFQISADSNILRIDTFVITDVLQGDTVFYRWNIQDMEPSYGFSGRVAGRVRTTLYDYRVKVTSTDDVSTWLSGNVCAVACRDSIVYGVPRFSSCAFPIQYDPATGYDENIDSQEMLDCIR